MKRKFTLIELLVVIGIICVLAAMLMPALSKAKESANRTDCLNNMKQLGLGFMMYHADFKDTFPLYTDGNTGVGAEGGWIFYDGFPVPSAGNFHPEKGLLYPYVNTDKVYVCRDDNSRSKNSYATNCYTEGLSITKISNSAETPLLLEEGTPDTTDDGFFAVTNLVANRHTKGSNYTFCDGHASFEKWPTAEVWAKNNFNNEQDF